MVSAIIVFKATIARLIKIYFTLVIRMLDTILTTQYRKGAPLTFQSCAMPLILHGTAVSDRMFVDLSFCVARFSPKLLAMEFDELVEAAWEARGMAYAPYSKFAVGAALLSADGRIFRGCNVENLSYGLTQCAERTAICAAVAAGVRDFVMLAVVADTAVPISPCGACRQVMAEFRVPLVILANRTESMEFSLEKLLPRATAGILDRGE
jgi:cytidine deaminase